MKTGVHRDRTPCSHNEYLRIGVLDPGKSWATSDYRIDRASGCACLKGACPGHVWLSLHLGPGNSPLFREPTPPCTSTGRLTAICRN